MKRYRGNELLAPAGASEQLPELPEFVAKG